MQGLLVAPAVAVAMEEVAAVARPPVKVEHLSDVRAILATKVGFQAQKQLEKKAISTFDLEADVDEALKKITAYYDRVDRHESLRGIR